MIVDLSQAMNHVEVGDHVEVVVGDVYPMYRGYNKVVAVYDNRFTVKRPGGAEFDWKYNEPYTVRIYKTSNNTTTMSNLKEKFKGLFLQEPEKSFRKAGVTNESGDLTTDGQEVFNQFLFDKYKDEFNEKVVQPILKAEEDKDKE